MNRRQFVSGSLVTSLGGIARGANLFCRRNRSHRRFWNLKSEI